MAQEQIRQPLLLHDDGRSADQNVQPSCPGCRAAHFQDKNAPIPFKELVMLAFVILANALPISVVYPFLYFMIEDLHVADKQEDIGYYAGWIGSSFMAGRVLTGVVWGLIADRYGRKIVMYCGIASVMIFNTLFGLSTNFWMALLSRFFLGCFNGMLGTVKAYASEICNEEHQAVGLSLVSTVWGFGLIVGPALGGFLAQPAVKYPHFFKAGSLFARFPYLLQALGVLVFTIPAVIMCIFLPETLHMNHTSHAEDQNGNLLSNDQAVINVDADKQRNFNEEEPKPTSIYKNWSFMASTMVYCVWSLHDIAYTEIFSLWAVSPRSYGGLSFSSSDVGQVLAVSGFAMLIFQLLVFPFIAKWLGAILTTRLSAIFTIPVLAVYPFFTKLHGTVLWLVLLTASILKYLFGQSAFTGSFILINNSVKQEQRGAANGVSLSVVSLFKAIGPAGGGSVFAWSQTRLHSSFLPGDHLVFFFLNIFALLTAIVTFDPILPKATERLL